MVDLNLSGFQPCDFRGLYGDTPEAQVSPLHAYLIGKYIATLIPLGEKALLSGDGRSHTPRLLHALSQGLGANQVNLGVRVPTPLAYYAKHQGGIHTSVIVTASHNPPAFNGIKIQIGPMPITIEQMAGIRDAVATLFMTDRALLDGEFTSQSREMAGIWADYKAMIARTFDKVENRALVLDPMYGCFSGLAPEVLRERGYTVHALRNEVKKDFHGSTPNPAEDKNILELMEATKGADCVLGAALDGDGDRARMVDEYGNPVECGIVLALLARHWIESGINGGKNTVVYDQKLSLNVINALNEAGAHPVIEKSGHAFIRTRMLNEDALVGGEKSGHFFWGVRYPVMAGDCGLMAILAVDEVLRKTGQTLSRLAASIPDSPFYTGDIRDLQYAGNREDLLRHLERAVAEADYVISTSDGVRIEKREGHKTLAFAHIRGSVTESDMLTAAFDASNQDALEEMLNVVTHSLPENARNIRESIQKRVSELFKEKDTL